MNETPRRGFLAALFGFLGLPLVGKAAPARPRPFMTEHWVILNKLDNDRIIQTRQEYHGTADHAISAPPAARGWRLESFQEYRSVVGGETTYSLQAVYLPSPPPPLCIEALQYSCTEKGDR
jgi:hypothetical protein